MSSEHKEEEFVEESVKSWEFDNWSCQHWEEQKNENVDQTKSWVELSNTELGQKLTIYLNRQIGVEILADRDMWGTWITFRIGDKTVTVAQEDETMSFVDSLIAGLTELRGITDIDTIPPIVKDFKNESEQK